MDLLVPLQLTGGGESHLAAIVGALVGWQLRMLLAHVGLQLLVLLELLAAALERADVFLLLESVRAADVSAPVGARGESLRAALHGAAEGLLPAVDELVPGQVERRAEGLSAALVLTRVWPKSRVFTQVGVQFPLSVVSSRAVRKRAEEALVRFCFGFHFQVTEDAGTGYTLHCRTAIFPAKFDATSDGARKLRRTLTFVVLGFFFSCAAKTQLVSIL